MHIPNYFQIIADRLSQIEALLIDLKHQPPPSPEEPHGDFKWLVSICPGIPASTLRIKSASGDIPGVIKFGKRILYDKAAVLAWLRLQMRMPINPAEIDQSANDQIARQLAKRKNKIKQ